MNEEPSIFTELKQLVIDFVEAKINLYKIGTYEKIAKITAILFSSVIIAFIAFFLLFFLSISGGFFFGKLLNSNSLGFLIIFGIYFILLIVLIIFRKQLLEKPIINRVIVQLFETENDG